jgi:hypothetical protein
LVIKAYADQSAKSGGAAKDTRVVDDLGVALVLPSKLPHFDRHSFALCYFLCRLQLKLDEQSFALVH